MFKRKVLLVAVIVMCLLTISAVSANDNTTDSSINLESANDLDRVMLDDSNDTGMVMLDGDDDSDKIALANESELEVNDNDIAAKLVMVNYPKKYGDKYVTFKLTNAADNSPLAYVDLSVMSYPAGTSSVASNNDMLGASLNPNPLTFGPDNCDITKITTNVNGIAVFRIPDKYTGNFHILVGFYDANGATSRAQVTYNDVKQYASLVEFVQADITNPQVTASLRLSKAGIYYGGVVVKGSLISTLKKPLVNEKVRIKFSNGQTRIVTTNSRGQASLYVPFGVGTYIATASVVSKAVHANSAKLSNIVVSKAPVNILPFKLVTTYASGKYFQVKVINSKTKKVAGSVKLTLRIYTGKSYRNAVVTTNSQGIARYLTSALGVGVHKVVVGVYDKRSAYGAAKTSSIAVKKAIYTITASNVINGFKKPGAFRALVKNKASGKAVANVRVYFKVYTGTNYKIYSATTNAKGFASISTKALSKTAHKVLVSVRATSNNYAAAVQRSIRIIDMKYETHFVFRSSNYHYHANGALKSVSITVDLVDERGVTLTKRITAQMWRDSYNINGEEYGDVISGVSGSAIEVTKWTGSWTFFVKIIFAGDSAYEKSVYKIYI